MREAQTERCPYHPLGLALETKTRRENSPPSGTRRGRRSWLRRAVLLLAALAFCAAAPAEEATSCVNHCGGEAPSGCSCDLSCAHEGNCCPDVSSACWAGIPEADWRGFERVLTVEPVDALGSPNSGQHTDATFLAMDEWDHNGFLGNPTMVGLTRVAVRDVDDGEEFSTCEAVCEDTYGDEWWNKVCRVKARSDCTGCDSHDNFAECSGAAIRFPNWHRTIGPGNWFGNVGISAKCDGGDHDFYYRGVAGYCGSNCDNSQVCLGGERDNYIPVLQGVKIHEADSHHDGDVGCRIDWAGGSCGWKLIAQADSDAGAGCMGRVMRTNDPMATYGPYHASVACGDQSNSACGKVMFKPNRYRARNETTMKLQANHMCFLSRNNVINVDDGSERASCEIVSKNGYWTLRAETSGWSNDLDAGVQCSAYCAKIHPLGFPGEPAASRDALGARMSLWQSGDYDMPVVFVEGFDPTDTLAESRYWREAAGLLNRMRDAGLDVWFVDQENAGQDVRKSAMEVAMAVYRAYGYGGWGSEGKTVPVIGVSMGALATRIAMTSWEDGIYTDPDHPDRYFNDGEGNVDQNISYLSNPTFDRKPPIDIAVSLVGPQNGANIAKSVQLMVQDFGDYHDIGESWTALNNPASVNMLQARIHPKCDHKVSQWCSDPVGIAGLVGAHGDTTFRDVSLIEIFGESVKIGSSWSSCPLDTQGCVRYPMIHGSPGGTDWLGNPIACSQMATPSQQFYGEVNSRGAQGNGFPEDVFMVGLSSAGFSLQGGANYAADYCADLDGYPDENNCLDYPTPLEGCHNDLSCAVYDADPLGDIRMQFPGATMFGFCERNTQVMAFLAEPDVRPGDLSERALTDLQIPAPKDMNLPIRQLLPMQFIPTDSALACPNAETLEECELANNIAGDPEQARRFAHIIPRMDNLNAIHGRVDDAQAAWILAYLWEGSGGDGDGNIGPAGTNPFYQSFMGTPDPDDADGTVYIDAPEICDGKDNNGDGVIDGVDEDGVVTWTVGTGEDCDGDDGDVCFEGVLTCDGTGPAYCSDDTGTILESCNEADDDCDGDIDEGFNAGYTCFDDGAGACRGRGSWECTADGSGTECIITQPGGEPSPEVCNNIDDDCDYQRDEDENGHRLTLACTYHGSACNAPSVRTCGMCSNGTYGYCSCEKPQEICNDGIDNDCDGDVDFEDSECTCLPAGTPIALPGGDSRAIQEIKIGDTVLSFDVEGRRVSSGTVTQVFVHPESEGMVVINGSLRATPNHPFFVNDDWARADELRLGDTLLILEGVSSPNALPMVRTLKVSRLELIADARETTYNIEVEGDHNYFAGGVLVHNKTPDVKPHRTATEMSP